MAQKKYYEVYMEPIEQEFLGVVSAVDEDDAYDKATDEDFEIQEEQSWPEQRGYELKEISEEEFKKMKAHAERT
jgi:hypothetical protein